MLKGTGNIELPTTMARARKQYNDNLTWFKFDELLVRCPDEILFQQVTVYVYTKTTKTTTTTTTATESRRKRTRRNVVECSITILTKCRENWCTYEISPREKSAEMQDVLAAIFPNSRPIIRCARTPPPYLNFATWLFAQCPTICCVLRYRAFILKRASY